MKRTTAATLLATMFVFAHHDASAMLRDAADNHDLAGVINNFRKSVRSHDGFAADRNTATAVVREVEHPQ